MFLLLFIFVIDQELPKISCPPDINKIASVGARKATIIWNAPQVTDNSGQPPANVWCSYTNGTELQIGGRDVCYSANDTSGNVGKCCFRVTVIGT